MTHNDITVTHSTYPKYKTVKCFKCNASFVYGDKIHALTTKAGQHKVYHKKCWDSNFY